MKIAIYGYGNLGKGVECAVKQAPDMELFGVFTRRAPETVKTLWADTRVLPAADIEKYKDLKKRIDYFSILPSNI